MQLIGRDDAITRRPEATLRKPKPGAYLVEKREVKLKPGTGYSNSLEIHRHYVPPGIGLEAGNEA